MNVIIDLCGAGCLVIICLINRRIVRSWSYPPTVFAAWWAFLLLSLALFGGRFYQISITTVSIYVVGAVCFSIGGLFIHPARKLNLRHKSSRFGGSLAPRIIDSGIFVLIIALPFYWSYIQGLSAESGMRGFWYGVRAEMVKSGNLQTEGVSRGFKPMFFDNLVLLGILVSLIAFMEYDRAHKRARLRTYIATTIALLYALMTAGSTGIAMILFSVLGIYWIRFGRLSKKGLTISLALFLLAFSIISVVVGKGRASSRLSVSDNLDPVVEVIEMYALGGVVAFDQVANNSSEIQVTWSVWRFFELTANKVGAHFAVPSLHAQYSMISPALRTNVYTLYFSYFGEYGWLGVITIMLMLGAVAAFIHKQALRGVPEAVGLYGLTFSGILLSGFNEQVFTNLNLHLKTIVFLLLIYRLWPMVSRRRVARVADRFELNGLAAPRRMATGD